MRFEYLCMCGVEIATQDDSVETEESNLLEKIHDVQVHSHIRNCKQALRNFVLSEVNKNGD